MRKIVTLFLCSLMCITAFAQSAEIMSLVNSELIKRGLSEPEVRSRLLAEGIDVDKIKPSEYASYQGRVTAILNQMEAEKSGSASGNAAPTVDTLVVQTGIEIVNPDVTEAKTTNGEIIAEEEMKENLASAQSEGSNDIYGHSIFKGKTLEVFRTTDGAQAPETYVLGEGDEIHISIFGSSQTEIHQRIATDGSIQPAGSSKIFLKGMTLAQGRAAIIGKLAQHFSFNRDQIAVTINTARTVNVSIYGEVAVQGGFTMSALNTTFNALTAAGGPTGIGSVRNIQLSRNGKTHRLDLYAYMSKPSNGNPYDIQNGDVIFVPVAQKIVKIEGAVNRPMRYELIEGEDLVKLINLAGGLKPEAYTRFVQIERYDDGDKKYLEYDLYSVISGGKRVDLIPGDIVRIKASTEPLEEYVNISGNVYYEGNYDLSKNSSLKTLIENAKPKYTARTDYVFIERTRPDETVEILTVPFPGTNNNPDFRLEKRDKVTVLELSAYRDVESISVNGQVRRPFTRQFGLNDKMTIAQAIELAGGIKKTGYPIAYIFRKDITNPELMEYKRVNLNKDGGQYLKPGDELRVYDNSTYTDIGQVSISGAVNEPVRIAFDEGITLHNLIEMAGGLTVAADVNRIEVFRVNLSDNSGVKLESIPVKIDKENNPVGAFQIQPYDHIVVRQIPDFTTGRTVEVNGRVKYPGIYVLEDGKTHLSEILQKAGGLLDDMAPYASIFRTYNNRGNIGMNLEDVMKNKRKEKKDPILMEGDVINVVRQENTVTIYSYGTRLGQYTPEELSAEKTTIVYQGAHSAKWYINNYAGGFDNRADKNSVTITLPNGQTMGTTKNLIFFRHYPTVHPGSVITLNLDERKVVDAEKPKEKVDWESWATKTLSSITSVVSIVLLLKRL